MPRTLEVLFSPVEFEALPSRDLSNSLCVVFDILRATSTMMTALANGAREIFPVQTIPEALALRERNPDILLAGERNGIRIRRSETGSIDFDLGNSPREFTAARVQGRSIAMTTSNGTRALNTCRHSRETFLGTFLGVSALHLQIQKSSVDRVVLICSGTGNESAFEDTIAAGNLCDKLSSSNCEFADSAFIARGAFLSAQSDLGKAMVHSRNARRLLSQPELQADVALCLVTDQFNFVAHLSANGTVRTVGSDYVPR